MQIKMNGTFSYDLVPGVSRRTLHAGLVLDEPVEVAQAAIDAGAAVRWPPVGETPAEGTGDEPAGGGEAGGGDTTAAAPKAPGKKPGGKKAGPQPPAAPAATVASEPSPAEPVEPGGDDDAGGGQPGDAADA